MSLQQFHINWEDETPDELRALRKYYQEALKLEQTEFRFRGHTFLVAYVKYVFELPKVQHKLKIK